jgi:ubiquinol-cytochrome c reductase iron-sulfur subunit
MALRRGIAGLLRPLLTAENALAPIAATSHNPLLTPEPSSSSSIEYAGYTSLFRRYASDVATTAPSGLSPVDKLSLSPTNMIKYDESNHHRYPPGLDHKSPALLVTAAGRFFYATAARLLALKFILSMSAAADVLAMASLEVDLSGIEEGQTVTVKWRGKPVFIRHRTEAEISEAEGTDTAGFRDPQSDAERVIDPKYLVVIGVCTHLGCVPIAGAGDYNGWFCPCHGTHYDISGRVRKGPAPYNLEVPEYRFITSDHTKAIIG